MTRRLSFLRSLAALAAAATGLLARPLAAEAPPPAQSPAQIAAAMAAFRALPQPAACHRQRVLILYDTDGAWGHLGELYALFAANLAGAAADYDALPVSAYRRGEIGNHALTIYAGTSFNEPLPAALAADFNEAQAPVMWFGYGLERLAAAVPDFAARYGFLPGALDRGSFPGVIYRGERFSRLDLPGGETNGQLTGIRIADPSKASVLASAMRSGGGTIPWAVRARNLTYIAENPFVMPGVGDRYLIFADLLARALAPRALEQHRALVRIEDVGPDAKPEALRAIADYLASRNVAFSVAVYDSFADPLGTDPVKPKSLNFAQTPDVVAALNYMRNRGGTLILHGHTHQYDSVRNPLSGKSGADAEFFRAHFDPDNRVIWDGPVAEDSTAYVRGRFDDAFAAWEAAELPKPGIIEFPHYAASALDYAEASRRFAARYERAFYFTGTLHPIGAEQVRFTEQFFPYPVRDVYGSIVLPEDIGGFDAAGRGQDLSALVPQMLETASKDWVVQGGVASFYFHRTLPLQYLRDTVEALQDRGWNFVSPQSLMAQMHCR